ncbi:unnamed protein product, partial [Symbiodinium pilosum]
DGSVRKGGWKICLRSPARSNLNAQPDPAVELKLKADLMKNHTLDEEASKLKAAKLNAKAANESETGNSGHSRLLAAMPDVYA